MRIALCRGRRPGCPVAVLRTTPGGPTPPGNVESVATRDDAQRFITELPGTTEGLRFRHVTWFVDGAPFVWDRPFSKADLKRFGDQTPPEGPILALRVDDLLEKEVVLADTSEAVFTIPHFEGFAAVLVQLSAVDRDELRELVVGAWAACAPRELVERHLGMR